MSYYRQSLPDPPTGNNVEHEQARRPPVMKLRAVVWRPVTTNEAGAHLDEAEEPIRYVFLSLSLD